MSTWSRPGATSFGAPKRKSRYKAKWVTIGTQRFYGRSQWEIRYGFYLEWLKGRGDILGWEHEPKTFWFEKIRRGCTNYLPDFRVDNRDGSHEWHEVKGRMTGRNRMALKRMAKYHPTERVVLIEERTYREIERKLARLIPGWD